MSAATPSITGPLILGALPLLPWPFLALASLMSLAGHRSGSEPVLLMLVAGAFQVGTLAYPVVYVASLVTALTLKKSRPAHASRASYAPLLMALGLFVLLALWVALE